MGFVRQLDLVVLAVALPVFLAAGLPMVGYAAGAGGWMVQKALQAWLTRRAKAAEEIRTTMGLIAGGMVGRGWLVALTIFGAYLIDGDDAGLAAAVLVLAALTVYFTVQLLLRPFDRPSVGR